MTTHPRAVTHVGVTVPDVEAAMDWYARVLDFDVVAEPVTIERGDGLRWRRLADMLGIEPEWVRIGHMTTGNQVGVECFAFDETAGTTETQPAEPGLFHVGVLDPDIETLASRIDAAGGDHYADIWALGDPEPRVTYCHDPWGNKIEIYTQSHERLITSGAPET